jgi:hypothetical protein
LESPIQPFSSPCYYAWLVGAIVYGLFVSIGVVTQDEFDQTTKVTGYAQGYARLVLGALLGFILYFALATDHFGNAVDNFREVVCTPATEMSQTTSTAPPNPEIPDSTASLYLLLPFIGGYSTFLVVGILGRLTQTIEVSLGLETPARTVASPDAPQTVARPCRQTG